MRIRFTGKQGILNTELLAQVNKNEFISLDGDSG